MNLNAWIMYVFGAAFGASMFMIGYHVIPGPACPQVSVFWKVV